MKTKQCHWCGETFETKHHAKLYCDAECRAKMGSFVTVIGKRIAAEAMAWRRVRGSAAKGGSDAFKRMVRLLDQANAEFVEVRPKGAPTINAYVEACEKANGIRRGMDR